MTAQRTCEGCTACCTTFGVEAIGKERGVPCSHAASGQGCDRYETRPDACRGFVCLWLANALPDEARPDRSGIILDRSRRDGLFARTTGVRPIVVRPCRPGGLEEPLARAVIAAVAELYAVVLLREDGSRTLIGPPAVLRRVVALLTPRDVS